MTATVTRDASRDSKSSAVAATILSCVTRSPRRIGGVMVVRTKEDADPMKALNFGYYVTAVLVTVMFAALLRVGRELEEYVLRLEPPAGPKKSK